MLMTISGCTTLKKRGRSHPVIAPALGAGGRHAQGVTTPKRS